MTVFSDLLWNTQIIWILLREYSEGLNYKLIKFTHEQLAFSVVRIILYSAAPVRGKGCLVITLNMYDWEGESSKAPPCPLHHSSLPKDLAAGNAPCGVGQEGESAGFKSVLLCQLISSGVYQCQVTSL